MSRPITEVVSLDRLQAAFVAAHASQEQARAARRQARADEQARSIRPMSKQLDGLGEQIAAATAAAKHVQNAAVGVRQRERDVADLQTEVAERRRQGGGRRVG
ncbi:hypothetical protein [Aeromicrobium alkaliterrae]|uniref:Uncharacterized protein n=1 Tax=Aeromicrobium alkaliterrae TaxID=302168 RepID=A0ABP4VWC8_9ACTN